MKQETLRKNEYNQSVEEVLQTLSTSPQGLSEEEARERQKHFGKNALKEALKKSLAVRFLEQFKSFIFLILGIAAIVSYLIGDLKSSLIILAVMIINAGLGVYQESKAEKAIEAIRKMASPQAEVRRNGTVKLIPAEELVMGDIVILETGDHIPADLRLTEAANLRIEESALTGESVPVEKTAETLDRKDIVIGDRKNMAYTGSSVVYGRGVGVVTAVGMQTELGKIAQYLSDSSLAHQTPLQKKLAELGKFISLLIVIISALIFVVGKLWGRNTAEMFLTSVSLAVAAIPEGLPAIVTIVLSLGVQKMAEKNAIIRKLPAVETLGSTQVICSDKTGTLTQNRMTVVEVYEAGPGASTELLQGMLLCNDSRMVMGENGLPEYIGDPTETALMKHAVESGVDKTLLEARLPRLEELAFDSDRKMMTTLHGFEGGYKVFTKGSVDSLLKVCTHILDQGQVRPMETEDVKRVLSYNTRLTREALRVLAFAVRELDRLPDPVTHAAVENGLVFVGLAGMMDPPREEVKTAVQVCVEAGIRPVMITGDHRDTAFAIALELGISRSEEEVITGAALSDLNDEELLKNIEKYSVYARVSPEHKVRIVNAWRQAGKIVAMTGDGVNDAPALKASDISVGMGITGTDVAKGVSDMILTDDNFSTIVLAVEEGRKIYTNIRKAVHFLLSTHLGEVFVLFAATLLNWVVLYPIHLLWVNLIIDTFPALGLGMEKNEDGIMKKPPRDPKESLFAKGLGLRIFSHGIEKGLLTLAAYYAARSLGSEEAAVTAAFTTLGLVQLAHVLTLRSDTHPLFGKGFFSNRSLLLAVAVSALLQILVVAVPVLNPVFRVVPLDLARWMIVLSASLAIIPMVEIQKWLRRSKQACNIPNPEE